MILPVILMISPQSLISLTLNPMMMTHFTALKCATILLSMVIILIVPLILFLNFIHMMIYFSNSRLVMLLIHIYLSSRICFRINVTYLFCLYGNLSISFLFLYHHVFYVKYSLMVLRNMNFVPVLLNSTQITFVLYACRL